MDRREAKITWRRLLYFAQEFYPLSDACELSYRKNTCAISSLFFFLFALILSFLLSFLYTVVGSCMNHMSSCDENHLSFSCGCPKALQVNIIFCGDNLQLIRRTIVDLRCPHWFLSDVKTVLVYCFGSSGILRCFLCKMYVPSTW